MYLTISLSTDARSYLKLSLMLTKHLKPTPKRSVTRIHILVITYLESRKRIVHCSSFSVITREQVLPVFLSKISLRKWSKKL